MNAIFSCKDPNKDWEGISSLWEGFFENYEAYKAGKILMGDEDKYRLLSIPGPSQYRAFFNLFNFFKDGEQLARKYLDNLDIYDLMDIEEMTARPMLEFLQGLCPPAYEVKGKNIVMASGSFWEQSPETRKKVISCLAELQRKGARVSIFARAKVTEEGMAGITEQIKNESRFGLTKRIPIHFVKVDNDLVQLEFPHTESSLFRLTMFLDFEKLEPELKEGKTKEDLSNFFDGLIREAL